MTKRIQSFLLALTMLMTSGLIACQDAPDDIPEDTTTAAPTETTTVAETSEYTAPASNYDGKNFTIAGYYYTPITATWKAATYCEAFTAETNGDVLNDALYDRQATVTEELNITFKLFPFTNLDVSRDELSVPILAGEHVCDIALLHASGLRVMFGVKGEYLIDLYDLEGVDFSHSWWNQSAVEEFTILDRMYAVTGDISLWNRYATMAYFFNKQVAEDHNLGNLYDLVRSGDWTLDRMMEMCSLVSRDLNGDGKMTEEDAYGLCHQMSLIWEMLYNCGVRMTEKDKDGISQLVVNNHRTATAVEKLVPFLNNDQITVSAEKFKGWGDIFKNLHLPMFKDDRVLFNYNQLLITMDLRDMDADYGILPAPKMDEEQEEYISVSSSWWDTFLIVPITNPNLKMTGEVVEAMGYYGQQMVTPVYVDVSVTNRDLRDADSEEMMNLVTDSLTYDLAQAFGWGSISSVIKNLSIKNNPNFSSAWAANEAKIQAAIDATFSGWAE